ncbi:hypothetical protein Amet_1483 [Alkaliphilus metalliredigens QYMF]|uniref:ABC-2 type transporter n=1 Tax=Alkaliphilus metalliredigens (strain QYMF) TaxID=293826 RepID=A6TNB1_ALKMQ|nr:hypothetical protein [Alkaliphilus metalliredigens]ABR47679.1 hypothetical protein Amet_1483 [Alkaliphilus metalliredigens QYMF]
MLNTVSIKADMKMIVRDPILILFFILPILISIVIRVMVHFLTPIIYDSFSLDLTQYYGYILSVVILMTPLMLGTVAGFLLIDERDSRIQELIKITPIGYTGYLINRLMLPFIGSMVYTIVTYFILNIYHIEGLVLSLISVLTGVQGIFLGYSLYSLAADKVQGLTYSKGFGIFTILALSDLLNVRWVSMLAALTPFYWITRLVVNFSLSTAFVAIMIHIIYFLAIMRVLFPLKKMFIK